jgi:phosphoglycolate phosphatase-like HAD superfamily hydrolase
MGPQERVVVGQGMDCNRSSPSQRSLDSQRAIAAQLWHTRDRRPTMQKRPVSLLITDLDNTLFDWVEVWGASFSALFNKTAEISGIPVSQLESEFKAVHQRHGTTEYAFSLEELPSLRAGATELDIRTRYKPAIDAFRAARDATLKLYPPVMDTLVALRQRGCRIVGYTESMRFYSAYRMRHLDLDLVLDTLYSPPDADLPSHMTPEQIARYPRDKYEPRVTVMRYTPAGEKKPNPRLLLDIIGAERGSTATAIYVGDSQMKDVAMAQEARVTEVWAKYGVAQDRAEYELLRRVTHWSDEDVERERELANELKRKGWGKNPNYVLEHSFSELLQLFEFVRFIPVVTNRKAEVLR